MISYGAEEARRRLRTTQLFGQKEQNDQAFVISEWSFFTGLYSSDSDLFILISEETKMNAPPVKPSAT